MRAAYGHRLSPVPTHRRPLLPPPLLLSCWVLCRAEEVRAKFERYGTVRDVYLPKDYCE